ncbi:hypothetical protein LTR48_002754 [Friedmanniomyces endolithicus]|uniref:SMP-30/Gluconolactonase/LRE-like region domain-containing protein n=1 Tax=Rachicladosporium monterosium TaxID=1507873 RepID=A0ABR0LA19_9PEZI|nr:hypothetical protein LTS09_000133 [Friedmanniomyces endolithicus]KAK0947374.1 hypothetical protein LTR29_001330 [Friedmanniomyces endolithicus]KAK1093228.1 hypothetical protein LTR48_002754 [Friedmanniomyces endolithicus]KAK1822680.1 hypothetical protein LTR12_002819 [Friedmanniomyces endolithicus]KAK5145750.1 hypothetical protein LTR32_002556 [Rachicladosporium monterosium]
MRTSELLIATASFLLANTLPFPDDDAVSVVWQSPNPTWIENLAVRVSGEILCTSLSRDAVFMVNPFEHTELTVVQFEPGNGALGIAEISNDVFVVVTCQVDLATSSGVPGSAAAWKLDMNAWTLGADDAVTLIANLTDVGLPDGVVALSASGVVLIADAGKGLVWKLDTNTGDYTIVIQDDIMISSNPYIPLGVDGVHIADDYLYFTNLGDNILCRVFIDAAGNATDEIEIVAVMPAPDDFALTADGTAYVVGANQLFRVSPTGKVDVLAGGINDTTLEGATSAQFGRTRDDAGVLYIGTNGGLLVPVGGRLIGGQLLAINVDQFA